MKENKKRKVKASKQIYFSFIKSHPKKAQDQKNARTHTLDQGKNIEIVKSTKWTWGI